MSSEKHAHIVEGVYPCLAELISLRAAARKPRRARRRGHYGNSGLSAPLMRDRGMEYIESRKYATGDDMRHIDWRLTARSNEAYTKLFQAERERLTLIVADTSPALYFGTRVRFKSVQAARAGAIAAWVAIRDGDRVGALRGAISADPVKPAGGQHGVLRVLDALVRWYQRPPVEDEGLAVALMHANRVLRPGSRLVVLADAGSVKGIPDERWKELSMHNEIEVLLLSDPLECDPPKRALSFVAPISDAQHKGKSIVLNLASVSLRKRWSETFIAPLDTVLAKLLSCGVRAHVLSSDAASESWL